MNTDPDSVHDYVPYVINKCFSGHIDSIMFANEMNINHFLNKKMQYDFLLNSLRKRKRFSLWPKKENIKDLECVKSYYGYSNEKAEQALRILTEDQIKFIKKKLETGGLK
jgi:hypothetical protein